MQVRKRGFKRGVQARHTKSTHSIQDGKHKEDSSEGQQIKLLFCVNLCTVLGGEGGGGGGGERGGEGRGGGRKEGDGRGKEGEGGKGKEEGRKGKGKFNTLCMLLQTIHFGCKECLFWLLAIPKAGGSNRLGAGHPDQLNRYTFQNGN